MGKMSAAAPLTDKELKVLLEALQGEDSFVFLETTRATSEDRRSLLFAHEVDRLVCGVEDSPFDFLAKASSYLAKGYYLAGWFSYEFGYFLEDKLRSLSAAIEPKFSLAELGVFRRPYIYDHVANSFLGEAWPVANEEPAAADYTLGNIRLNQQHDDYILKINEIKKFIEAGDTYQVNYTLKLLFDFSGSVDALYRTLRRNQSVSYGAYLKRGERRVLSFSPELFFRKKGDTCWVKPMKGTGVRGRNRQEDSLLAGFLRNDIKNRSENVMIVDLLRNDLGRLSRMGSVEVTSLFDVEPYETLYQMTSSIKGELRDGVTLAEIFKAIFPCGSVTGAPKIRTMEIIRQLELESRGIYTGGIGYLSPEGDAVFNVPIRTVVLDGGHGEMGLGSGIVYDSDPEKEWEECKLKGRFLTNPSPVFQLIETLLWLPQAGYWLFDYHLDRLLASAQYFGYPVERHQVIERLAQMSSEVSALSEIGQTGYRVRLLLHKDGQLEVTATACLPPLVKCLPTIDDGPVDDLPRIVLSNQRTDSSSLFLYHKTTCRQLFDRQREQAVQDGFVEVVFCNEKGEVTEGSITNIFARKGDVLYTPPLTSGLLAGVFRQYLLAGCPGSAGNDEEKIKVKESVLTIDDLKNADALYVGNSVRGLVRVSF
ncbi:MAG: aminodeoxychorismate synthase component I [Proteobacteria bacterium]|nr:aminodeoxychorismate synthase component I [Pseudomonadota bacterium]MBU1717062.1 aminodeoxychorismate synthase component I [Pseudomonadota bacterium]